jgi:methylenetetrahydrofolate reductase (NADPH)
VTEQARALVGYADAVNVTDNPTGVAHMSPVAGVSFVREAGLEPTMQITCRDRNRLGLSADLLGGWALGARNLFCLTGDPITDGEATAVNDLNVNELVRAAATLREEGRLPSGAEVDDPPRFFIGVADLPLAPMYDPARLESKLDAGADFVMTQIVYDMDAFEAWADAVRARGVFQRASVIAGVAPPRSARSARFMNEHLPGVSVPKGIIRALEEAGPGAESEGVRLTIEIVQRLRGIAGVAGVHVMGLGREEPVRHVIEGAGLLPRPTGTA